MAKEPEPFSLFGDGEEIDLQAFLDAADVTALPGEPQDGPPEVTPEVTLDRPPERAALVAPTTPPDDPDEAEEISLDELDLSAYNRHWAGAFRDSTEFTEHFLAAVAQEYAETGEGQYDCLLVFRHSYVTDEDVFRFRRSVASRISRLRAAAPHKVADFRVVTLDYAILPDRRHVLLRTARMTEARFQDWIARKRRERSQTASVNARLAKLL